MSLSKCRAEATRNSRGFTLIETLIATGITLTALVAVAAMFAYSARTNILTEQRTTGILLATSKLEELRSTPSISTLTVGGGLDAASPTASYFEYVTINSSGAITTSTTAGTNPFCESDAEWSQNKRAGPSTQKQNPVDRHFCLSAGHGPIIGQWCDLLRQPRGIGQ
jgi:Tfp pilus assembly protein PilW